MKIAVTDANIFIDLIEIEIFHFLFELGLEIHTTKAVYDQLIPEQQAIVEPCSLFYKRKKPYNSN